MKKSKSEKIKNNIDETTVWFIILLAGINLTAFTSMILLILSFDPSNNPTPEMILQVTLLGSPILIGSLGLLKQVLKRDKNTPILKSTKYLLICVLAFTIIAGKSRCYPLLIELLISLTILTITYQKARKMPDYYYPVKGNWLLGHKIGAALFFIPIIILIIGGTIYQYTRAPILNYIIGTAILFWFLGLAPTITILLVTPITPVLNRKTKDTPADLAAYGYILFWSPMIIGTEAMDPTAKGLIIANLATGIPILLKVRKKKTAWIIISILIIHGIITALKAVSLSL